MAQPVSRTPTPTLPPQVSPPQFALSGALPHALTDVDVVALPVLPAAGADDQDASSAQSAEMKSSIGIADRVS